MPANITPKLSELSISDQHRLACEALGWTDIQQDRNGVWFGTRNNCHENIPVLDDNFARLLRAALTEDERQDFPDHIGKLMGWPRHWEYLNAPPETTERAFLLVRGLATT